MTPITSATNACVTGIEHSLDDVFATADRLREQVIALWGDTVRSDDLTALQQAIFAELDGNPHYTGAGFLAEPGALTDAGHYLEWWQPGSNGGHDRLVLDLDPTSPEIYDYPAMDWYVSAKAGYPSLRGPYLDYAGADRFVLTFALPVHVGDDFVGTTGVDVLMAAFDPMLFDHVRHGPEHVALVDRNDRVIVSNSPDVAPSERLRSPTGEAVAIGGEGVGWRLYTID